MAGINVKIDDGIFQQKIRRLVSGLEDAEPLMKVWGEIAKTSIEENFDESGRPTWKPLAESTIRAKGHARPLIGRSGNLRRITVQAERSRVLIGSNPAARDYAARQQFGWPGTGSRAGGKVKTPARPFIVLQDEDREEMAETARRYVARLAE